MTIPRNTENSMMKPVNTAIPSSSKGTFGRRTALKSLAATFVAATGACFAMPAPAVRPTSMEVVLPIATQNWDDLEGYELGMDELFEKNWEAMRSPFIVADMEVTAAPTDRGAEILEFAALLVSPEGHIMAEFSQLVRVKGDVPVWLLEELLLSEEEIAHDGHDISVAMASFLEFIGQRPVFIHHSSFDEPFLKEAASMLGHSFDNPLHDTLTIAEITWPQLERYGLKHVMNHLGLPEDMPRAPDCARSTLALLLAARDLSFAA